LESGLALEAQPANRLTGIVNPIDALKHRPAGPRMAFRILREVSPDDRWRVLE
jgi:hypothetical protein